MKKLIIPLLLATALLSGCHRTTVRHEVHQPVQVVETIQHRHVHDSRVMVHRHAAGQQPGHRHAQFNNYGPNRVVVVKPRQVIKPRVVTVRKDHRVIRGDYHHLPQGHGRPDNGIWGRKTLPRPDHRHNAKNRVNIWKVVRDTPHDRGDRDRSHHEHSDNNHGRDNGGYGHDGSGNDGRNNNGKANNGKANNGKANNGKANNGKANNGKANNGKANNGKANNKVARKNSDEREKQREEKGRRSER